VHHQLGQHSHGHELHAVRKNFFREHDDARKATRYLDREAP
jgi:hypothetical protein